MKHAQAIGSHTADDQSLPAVAEETTSPVDSSSIGEIDVLTFWRLNIDMETAAFVIGAAGLSIGFISARYFLETALDMVSQQPEALFARRNPAKIRARQAQRNACAEVRPQRIEVESDMSIE